MFKQISSLFESLFLDFEQLEKAREIIKQLKEEKNRLVKETQVRVQQTEQVMEEEKEKLVHELSRGKAAAVSLIQVCSFLG